MTPTDSHAEKLPTVSAAQRRALLDASGGVVTASEATVRALVRNRVLDDPTYRYGRTFASGHLTELGRAVVARLQAQP